MTQRQAHQILQPWGFTTGQVAGLLGVSTNTIYRWFQAVDLNAPEADREINDSFWLSLLNQIKAEDHAEALKSVFVREGRLGAYRYVMSAYDETLRSAGA